MPDLFTANPGLLKGQPKRAIADYVERAGFLVPRRFASLAEAVAFNGKVLVRSENEQDYDGEPNLFHSAILDKRRKSYGKLREHLLSLPRNRINKLMRNEKNPLDVLQQVKDGTSYSFWEYLQQGQNRTMVADNALRGRYHIFNVFPGSFSSWTIVENGKIIKGESIPDCGTDIAFYEGVRNIGCFDPLHCPSIEYQAIGNQRYFLQYFRTNDFKEADFVLDRPLEEGEIEADFVKGSTRKDGVQRRIQFPQNGGGVLY